MEWRGPHGVTGRVHRPPPLAPLFPAPPSPTREWHGPHCVVDSVDVLGYGLAPLHLGSVGAEEPVGGRKCGHAVWGICLWNGLAPLHLGGIRAEEPVLGPR